MTHEIHQNPDLLKGLVEKGFVWVRRLDHRKFEKIVREPTIGCLVEFSVAQDVYCVRVDSPHGHKLLTKKCYF